jgi:predicted kinase
VEAIIFIGIQGSGKSSFYKERFFRTHVRINLDMLRTRHREHAFLQTCLRTGQRFVVDNTNPTIEQRARYIVAARGPASR